LYDAHTTVFFSLFFFILFSLDPAPTYVYTLSLHDALPIFRRQVRIELAVKAASNAHICADFVEDFCVSEWPARVDLNPRYPTSADRKSTRLNSSHQIISYAVFCLKKKKTNKTKKKKKT